MVGCGEHIEISEVGQYIKHALESKETECTKLACGIISDLSAARQDKMSEFLDDFVPCLHDILKDQQVHNQMKIPALGALGDLAVYCGESFGQNYLPWTLQILDTAGRTATSVDGFRGDSDTLEFLGELREEVIELYITVLLAAADAQCLPLYGQHLTSIFDFVERVFSVDGYVNVRVVRQAVALVGDIATQFPQEQVVKNRAVAAHIEQGIQMLQQADQESKEQAQYTLGAVRSVLG